MQELSIKKKLTDYYYFVIFNSILSCIIGAGYWLCEPVNFLCMPIPKLKDYLDLLYIITTHFSVITLLAFLASLVLLPAIYLSPKKTMCFQYILASLFIGILMFDVGVFYENAVHLIDIDVNVVSSVLLNKDIMFHGKKIIVYIAFIIFIALIYFTNNWINKTSWLVNNKIGTKFTGLLLSFCIVSLLTYYLSTKEKQQQLLAYVQYLPINNNNNAIISAYKQVKHGKLQYPVNPLQATTVTSLPNILIIALDAWRADCFNEVDSPNLWKFAQKGKIFNNHISGGNHTRSGLFSLFYAISSHYCHRFKQHKIPALFFSRLKQLDYQVNIFTTDSCIKDFINNTQHLYVINNKNIRLYSVDKQITNNWLKTYDNLDKTKPWFSFVFFDSLHGPDFPDSYSTIAKPATWLCNYKKFAKQVGKQGFINSYKTSVHYIDSLAKKVLTQLKEDNDLENTIVIITADHGCEWNDNNQGQWGYGNNFINCQIQVPLAIILPKQYQNQLINQQDKLTTHYDIAPTLMRNFLGITNNIEDYSIGDDLLNIDKIQEWSLATSLRKYGSCSSAIIENDKVLKFNANGILNNIDHFNQLILNKAVNTKYLNQALEYMTRFIKK